MAKTVTEEQAQAALAAIREQFKSYLEPGYEPEIIRDWNFLDYPTPVAIVWEEGGPDEWAYRAQEGGRDIELTLEVRSIPGMEEAVIDTPPASSWPEGVGFYPVTSFAIGLFLE
jgi:hypothetical protein